MNKSKSKIASVLTLGVLSIALLGCEKEGPAEKAGKEIDQAIGSAEGKIQSLGKELESALK